MAEKEYQVTALGELLIDFTHNGTSENGNWLMEANPGGAPCNVLAMLTKLGHKTSFIGQVGNDMFGKMLKERISALGIGTEGLVLSEEYNTTLAFVHNTETGERDFSFYRKTGADAFLSAEKINTQLIKKSKILHYGTLSMTNSTVFEATQLAIETAKASDTILSFDPNLRKPLWTSLEEAKEKIWYGISQCDILKISDDELEFITDIKDIPQAVKLIRQKKDIPLITVTKGKNGSCIFYKNSSTELYAESPAFTSVKTIDTTGAGDTFCGCILHNLLENGFENFTEARLIKILTFANAASGLVTTKKGALCVMPEKSQILELLKSVNLSA